MFLPFVVLSILVFLLIAAAGTAAFVLRWPVIVLGLPVRPEALLVIAAIALLLAIGLWWDVRRLRRSRAAGIDAPTAERAPTRSATRSTGPASEAPRPEVIWHDPATGMRLPAKYFMFASAGVPAKKVREAADKYGRIMVGFDSGNVPDSTLKAARQCGAELEVYVEGPGGPTGDAWLPDEAARIKVAAQSVGVDTARPQKTWMKDWNDWGWKGFTFKQLEGYLHKGYSAAEIDNLYRALGDDPGAYVRFYTEYAALQVAGKLPRLILKNQSEDQLKALVAAVQKGDLPRSMFAEFHISEKGTGDRKKQNELSSRIGIRTVPSNDTYNYDAYGEFGLDTQYAAMFPPKPGPMLGDKPALAPPAPPVGVPPPPPVAVAAVDKPAVAPPPPPPAAPPAAKPVVAEKPSVPPPPAPASPASAVIEKPAAQPLPPAPPASPPALPSIAVETPIVTPPPGDLPLPPASAPASPPPTPSGPPAAAAKPLPPPPPPPSPRPLPATPAAAAASIGAPAVTPAPAAAAATPPPTPEQPT
jgi:hypothetical protein